MKTINLASLALIAAAALGILAITSAHSADIYDQYAPRTASPYDDPRYGDVFTHPAPPQPRYAEPRYEQPPYVEPPRERYYSHNQRDRYGYLEPMNPPRHSNYGAPVAPHCVPRGEIRRSLVNEGWNDFRELELQGQLALINARRPSGQLYALRVDRCSGEIIGAKPLYDRPVPYAYRERYEERRY